MAVAASVGGAAVLFIEVWSGWNAAPPLEEAGQAATDAKGGGGSESELGSEGAVGDADPLLRSGPGSAAGPAGALGRGRAAAGASGSGEVRRNLGLVRGGDSTAGLEEISAILKRIGKTPKQLAHELETTDKQTLWKRYGEHFKSKEEAKAAYEEYQRRKSSGKLPN